jgi:putative SOS response-associated peptidase YedK
LWEHWDHDQGTLYSCTIITNQATGIMQPIHERMPVIIPPDGYLKWLDKATDGQQVLQLLDNDAYAQMVASPVSDWVNNPRHYDERCL